MFPLLAIMNHAAINSQVQVFVWTCIYNSFRCIPRTEKAMATHSGTLAWKIPWMEGPGGLQSMGSLGVGHD